MQPFFFFLVNDWVVDHREVVSQVLSKRTLNVQHHGAKGFLNDVFNSKGANLVGTVVEGIQDGYPSLFVVGITLLSVLFSLSHPFYAPFMGNFCASLCAANG